MYKGHILTPSPQGRRNLKVIISLLLIFLSSPSFSLAFDAVILKSTDIKPYNDVVEGFRRSCDCDDRVFLLHEIKNENTQNKISALNLDLILAIGIDALKRVQTIKNIPIVYTMIPLPHYRTFEQNNIYGIYMFIPPGKQIDAILEVFPYAKRIGLIYDPQHLETFVEEAQAIAKSKNIDLIAKKTSRPEDVPSLIKNMQGSIDVFWMLPDTTIVNSETVDSMLLFSFQNKTPIFTFSKKYLEMGAAAGLLINPYDIGMQAGDIAKKLISEGKKQGTFHSYPRKTELVINRKITNKLGIKIREEILRKADVLE